LAKARLFGSVARADERPDSDVDLLVDVPVGIRLVASPCCHAELEELLGVRLVLVPTSSLQPAVAVEVLAPLVTI
jgi:hypothetical protein